MTATTLVAKANEGTGTDQLAGRVTPTGFAADIVMVSEAGTPYDVGNPLPVSGPLTDAQMRAAAVPVSGPLTDAQMRAAAVPVSGPLTDAQMRAAAVPVSGPLTDAQMRAAAVPVSGPLTDAQMRAAAVPVSGPLTDAQLRAAPLPLPTGAATEATLSSLNAKLSTSTTIPDNQAAGIAVRPVGQDTWVASFSAAAASFIDPQFRTPDVGTGVGYSQATGALFIASGTAANAEFLTRSLTPWRGTMQLRYSMIASQRIANNNMAVLLADLVGENLAVTVNSATSVTVALPGHTFTAQNVGQFMFVGGISGVAGVPGRYAIASVVAGASITFTVAGWPASGSGTVDLFGHSHVKHLYNGVTATAVAVDAQRRGWASGDTTLTINTTAGVGHIMQAHMAGREVFWHDTLRASTATPNMTSRGSRFENLPDDNLDLYLWLWSYNGTVAPASNTNWQVNFVSVEKFANMPVYLQGQEMQGTAAPAPVTAVGTTLISGAVTVGTSITGGAISPLTQGGGTVEASSAKTATGLGTARTNDSGRGGLFLVNVTAVTGAAPTLVVRIQVQDPVSLAWFDIPGAATASITASGLYVLAVYPGVAAVANAAVNYPLPRNYRAAWAITGTTPSFTFSIGFNPVL
jgi:hypothetical protein